MKTASESPALFGKSKHYPKRYAGKVPSKIRMIKTVHSDIAFFVPRKILWAYELQEYECWVNCHGAVVAITADGELGVKPDEFVVVEYHQSRNKK